MEEPIWGLVEASLDAKEAQVSCRLCFAPSEPFFAGHFPAHPLVPGVVLIESLVRLARRWTDSRAPLLELVDAKFTSEVRPSDMVECRLRREHDAFVGEMHLGERSALKVTFRL